MGQNVRFGIVGLGMGKGRAKICTATEGAELVAVCEIWEDRVRAFQEEHEVEWIREFDELLARDDIDVVGIWTPSGMHCDMAIRALEAGKHVCMTKPMDIKTDVCDRAIEAARSRNLTLAVDFDSRYKPVNHKIANAISSGAIGDVVLADLRMKWYRAQSYYDGGMPEGWRSRLGTEGGSLANQAVHFVDLLQWWLGPVVRVTGKKGTYAHAMNTEDATVALLEFESGARASVVTTTCSYPNLGTAIEVSGTAGTLSWRDQGIETFKAAAREYLDSHSAGVYVLPENQKAPEPIDLNIEDFLAPEGMPANIIEDMVRAVRDGTQVMCDGIEGRKSVAIVEGVYASSESETWLAV